MTSPQETIASDSLFDLAYYVSRYGEFSTREEAIADYLSYGEVSGRSPAQEFDPSFYRTRYSDLQILEESLLVHYILFGRNEKRYASASSLMEDVFRLKESGYYDLKFIREQLSRFPPVPGTILEQFLLQGSRDLKPTPSFDSAFYRAAYLPQYPASLAPVLAYLQSKDKARKIINPSVFHEIYTTIKESGLFDVLFYQQALRLEPTTDCISHYILFGAAERLDPSPSFSTSFYLSTYLDISEAGLNPLYHYAKSGRDEGRLPKVELSDTLQKGSRLFNPALKTFVIATHDCSHTGAPLLALNIVREMASGSNIIVWCGAAGALLDEFILSCSFYAVGFNNQAWANSFSEALVKMFCIECVIANSVESVVTAVAFGCTGVPVISLIHEFAEYTLPKGKMAVVVEASDRVLVPARVVLESLQKEVSHFFQGPANNVAILPQGRLKYLPTVNEIVRNDLTIEELFDLLRISSNAKPRIVVGAGSVQARKGVDLFLQVAASHKRSPNATNLLFVWVGSGYDPSNDMQNSVWIADTIVRASLDNTVFFIPAQSDLSLVFGIADAFLLSSRLDPYPNVVIDAMSVGLPIFLFEKTSGIEEIKSKFDDVEIFTAPYLDVDCMERLLSDRLVNSTRCEANADFVKQSLSLDRYICELKKESANAKRLAAEITRLVDVVKGTEAFDRNYFQGTSDPTESETKVVRKYCRLGVKGLVTSNPCPGLNEGYYRSLGLASPVALAYEDWKSRCHDVYRLKSQSKLHSLSTGLRVALHLHLHYSELAEELATIIAATKLDMDLAVTYTSEKDFEIINKIFGRVNGNGRLLVEKVPNRGRDIGPLMFHKPLIDFLSKADVIGHIHGKKSKDVGGNIGDRWRQFLVNTLIGDVGNVREILSLFADETLGLVFAEDRHSVGWGKNKDFAFELASEFDIEVPKYPVFPIGTMFWARTAVLDVFWSKGLRLEMLPLEPVPYDGSVLHAIERLIPAICTKAGLRWSTIYKPELYW